MAKISGEGSGVDERFLDSYLKIAGIGDEDGDGVEDRSDPDSSYYQKQLRKKQQDPQADEDDDGIINRDDPDSTYYQQQQQAQQTEQQTIALQEQAEAAQMQTVVIAVGLAIIVALLLAAVVIIAKRKKGATEEGVSQSKSETVGINGSAVDDEPVEVGDKLEYEFEYHNFNETAARIFIFDIVPVGATYVYGSASEGVQEIIESGKVSGLLWEFNANPGAGGTVSFEVEVNSNLAGGYIEDDPGIMIGEESIAISKSKNLVIGKTSGTVSDYSSGSPVAHPATTSSTTSFLNNWKTSIGATIGGIVLSILIFGNGSSAGFIDLFSMQGYLTLALIIAFGVDIYAVYYALAIYPSYFTTSPKFKNSTAISFLNGFLGGIIFGCIWNSNLTNQYQGISNKVFAVFGIIAIIGGIALSANLF